MHIVIIMVHVIVARHGLRQSSGLLQQNARPLLHASRKKDRLEMAIAYLRANPDMSVKQYSKMTGLKKNVAEAELNVFAQDALNPIKPVPGKKNL